MNSKRILSIFLVATMFVPYTQCISSNASAQCKVPVKTFGERFSKKDKLTLGIGGGLLLAGGTAIITVSKYKKYKKTAKYAMRLAVDRKNNGDTSDRFVNEALKSAEIFNYVGKKSANVAVCYYGKDAFKNCVLDMKMSNTKPCPSYEHGDDLVWYDSENQKYQIGKRKLNANELKNLRYFIEYNGVMYEAIYEGLNSTSSSSLDHKVSFWCDDTFIVNENESGKVKVQGKGLAMAYSSKTRQWKLSWVKPDELSEI